MLKLRRGKFSLIEEKNSPVAQAVGLAIKDLSLPPNCVISGILRRNELLLTRGMTVMEAGDEILALVEDRSRPELAGLLGRPAL